eukprot:TRINITY_DN24889_c0_g1_i2.p3 TRINITY_DN24889_c0_g1~~TRINITY_DN24889_c0_g1_i2.p3  ORF type:complete len:248 (+),score=-6.34 TRINITY_DN24889_c0_g1_i2:405-1148(+)
MFEYIRIQDLFILFCFGFMLIFLLFVFRAFQSILDFLFQIRFSRISKITILRLQKELKITKNFQLFQVQVFMQKVHIAYNQSGYCRNNLIQINIFWEAGEKLLHFVVYNWNTFYLLKLKSVLKIISNIILFRMQAVYREKYNIYFYIYTLNTFFYDKLRLYKQCFAMKFDIISLGFWGYSFMQHLGLYNVNYEYTLDINKEKQQVVVLKRQMRKREFYLQYLFKFCNQWGFFGVGCIKFWIFQADFC